MPVTSRGVVTNVFSAGAETRDPRIAVAGLATLIAGSATENLEPGLAFVVLERVVAGGALGHLTSGYVTATGVLTITSSSGTDTSTVAFLGYLS